MRTQKAINFYTTGKKLFLVEFCGWGTILEPQVYPKKKITNPNKHPYNIIGLSSLFDLVSLFLRFYSFLNAIQLFKSIIIM